MDPRELAKEGFYWIKVSDIVMCPFCFTEIGDFVTGDNIRTLHIEYQDGSIQCSFLLKPESCKNVPLTHDDQLCTIGNPRNAENLFQPKKRVAFVKPLYPEFEKVYKRYVSFHWWPRCVPVRPQELAECGFFYLEKGDCVKCFSCGGVLTGWSRGDRAWEEHAKHYPNCTYLLEKKGEDFVLGCLENCCDDQDDEEGSMVYNCIACKDDAATVYSQSCGHLSLCRKCAMYRTRCPECGERVKNFHDLRVCKTERGFELVGVELTYDSFDGDLKRKPLSSEPVQREGVDEPWTWVVRGQVSPKSKSHAEWDCDCPLSKLEVDKLCTEVIEKSKQQLFTDIVYYTDLMNAMALVVASFSGLLGVVALINKL